MSNETMTTPTSVEILGRSSQLSWEIGKQEWDTALQRSSHLKPPGIARQVALNHLLLDVIAPCFAEILEMDLRPCLGSSSLDRMWSVVSGTAFETDRLRLVMVPTESLDTGVCIAQEWVDISGWIADYYLTIFVDVEGRIASLRGLCTHKQLKEKGQFDSFNRTYILSAEDAIADIDVISLAAHFGLDLATRSQVLPLTDVTSTQAINLLTQLGNPKVPFPRLERPFELWAACFADEAWRNALFARRQLKEVAVPSQAIANLADWFANIPGQLANGWRNATESSPAFAFRAANLDAETVTKTKDIRVAGVDLVLGVNVEPQEKNRSYIRAFVKPAETDANLPNGLEFDLLDKAGTVVQSGNPAGGRDYRSEQNVSIDSNVVFCLRISVGNWIHEEWLQTP